MKVSEDMFIFNGKINLEMEFTTEWTSPSNIALIKYWGKYDNQIPANPSISFTLANCHTQTTIVFSPSEIKSFEIWSEGEKKDSFRPKIEKFLKSIKEYCPYLDNLALNIETKNTFPHSSGIASSASGLSAIALCIMSLEKKLVGDMSEDYFYRKASFLARLGSGSAARSVYPVLASWGDTSAISSGSNLVATSYSEADSFYNSYQDAILIIDEGEKVVSSTVGHGLMNNHPYAKNRFDQAHSNLSKLLEVMKSKERVDEFISIVESEALTLHAMMMTSNPYFILMKPNTLKAIERIWNFRKESGSKICFTLDAGANVHVLYPENEKEAINTFIKNSLAPLCMDNRVIFDHVGNGPQQLA